MLWVLKFKLFSFNTYKYIVLYIVKYGYIKLA